MSIPDSALEIPKSTLEAIRAYVEEHQPPGRFLEAVLENNFVEAALRADQSERAALAAIILHCHGNIPTKCWGNWGKVQAWLLQKPEEPEKVT